MSAIIASMSLPALWQASSNYKISTDVYEGPLDLLLQLIEQAELDITKISLAKVTDQYLSHIRNISHRNAVEVSAFLVIASKLVLIKSSILLPTPDKIKGDEEEEDIGDQLVRQLLLYKFFKDQSKWLKERQEKGLRSYYRVTKPPKIIEKLDLSDVKVIDLVDILLDIYFQEEYITPLSEVVTITTLTIRNRIQEIVAVLNKKSRQTFSNLIEDNKSRLNLVVTFLALLELIKNYSVRVNQPGLFQDIELEKTEQITSEIEPEI
ncbi:MAG TPA: hypothetical protein ENL46_05660 [Candidatus Aminicenantes bacterium]|nr:hypothetical protein [Candidatus Aminicenantes bacterium]